MDPRYVSHRHPWPSGTAAAAAATASQKRSGDDNAIQEPAAKQPRTRSMTAAAANNNNNDNAESPQHSNAIVAITPLPVRRLNDSKNIKNNDQPPQPPSPIHLPKQVPNIFFHSKRRYTPCQCSMSGNVSPPAPCTGRCMSVDFLHDYGWEYKTLLKEMEAREYEGYDEGYAYDSEEDDDEVEKEEDASNDTINNDPYLPLVSTGIVPAPEKRTDRKSVV